MKIFTKVFLILLCIEAVRGDVEFCEKKNVDCPINEINQTAGLSTLVGTAVQYFSNINQNLHAKINSIAGDIESMKKLLQINGARYSKCMKALEQTSKPEAASEVTKDARNLYNQLWVIIQRRQEGSVSFYRSWVHYVVGFGNPLREFFIGLDRIHYLTNSRPHELIIKLEDFKGHQKYARYDYFLVGNGVEKYQLKKLGNYSGNAGDYLRSHVGMFFSTRDKDNDASEKLHCAKIYQGGWWYHDCMTSNLNGPFRTRYEVNNYNMTWDKLDGTQYKFVQMMIRSKG